jgi:hypothetical protein
MFDDNSPNISEEDLFPSLRDLLKSKLVLKTKADFAHLSIGHMLDGQQRLSIPKREEIYLVYDEQALKWENNSIRVLFRGNKLPPDLQQIPEQYEFIFFNIECSIVTFSEQPDMALSDADFRDIFSAMRRRPDGRRINLMHDLIWQSTALAMALMPYSEAEYNAIFSRLEQSARSFNLGCGSKNYLAYLQDNFSD